MTIPPIPAPSPANHDRLRARWLSFFGERSHALPPSASLVPENDPTLLFTGAGMNQFKDLFLGKIALPYRRAATAQRCLRQGDLENVGRTPRHLTFFEMLGHFSFGDYFKREAIAWAWELLTKDLGFTPERLFVSVYQDDAEALESWLAVGVPRSRIARFDAKENFWPANAPDDGPNGPCGPCSEIFFDYGAEAELGDGSAKSYDSGRYVEIWNTVFTQFDRRGVQELVPLPQRNIDCGAGLERVLAAMEGQRSPFGTTLFRPLVTRIAEIARREYPFDPRGGLPPGDDGRRMRRIADHVRAGTFLVSDGVKPGNEGRGYVLRRILRRAIRDGIQLGLDRAFLADVVPTVVATMGSGYPLLRETEPVVRQELEAEELRFRETYARGVDFLEAEIQRLPGKVLDGAVAFRLHDTYGFPLDLAETILAERGLSVDRAGFEKAMQEQRERARAGAKMRGDIFAVSPLRGLVERMSGPEPAFVGHDGHGGCVSAESTVVGIVRGDGLVDALAPGEEGWVVLRSTPFYAESGGQVGDTGALEDGGGVAFRVEDTVKKEGLHVHVGRTTSAADGGRGLRTGQRVTARVDEARRWDVRRNHTATHLLHKVLKTVLGEHVAQQGSLVAPERLRFDFSHPKAVTPDELRQIEERVNAWVLQNREAETRVMELEAAKASGAVAMFGEKYEGRVRVLDVPGLPEVAGPSRELCGGTHVARTGDIGAFRILSEGGIAAGVRRLEAATGRGAERASLDDRRVLRELSERLKARPEELAQRLDGLLAQVKDAQKALERVQSEAAGREMERLVVERQEVGGLRVTLAALSGLDGKALKGVWDRLQAAGVAAAVLVSASGGKAPVFVGVGEAGQARGLDAGALLKVATAVLGGGGGGRRDQAQGQGADPTKAAAALDRVRDELAARLG